MRRLLYILFALLCAGALCSAVGAKKSRSLSNEIDTVLYNYLYMEGERQQILGNYDAALALTSEALRVNPSALAAKYSLSKSYLRLNQVDTALTLMQQAADGDTTNYWYNIAYANTMTHLQQYDNAESVVKRIIRNHPNRPDVYNLLATIYIYKTEYDKALACYDSIETYLGNSPELASYRIALYDAKGDTTTAIEIAEELVEKSPSNIYYALYLSSVYNHYGCDSLRLQLLDKVKTIAPDEPMLLIELADYHLSQGDTTAYHEQYNRLLNNENIEFDVKYQLFGEYIDKISYFAGDTTIITAYNKMVDLYPYETELRKKYASILLYYNKNSEACEHFSTIALQSDSCENWEQLMIVAQNVGEYALAIDAGNKVIERGGENCTTYVYMASAMASDGKYDEALQYVSKGLELCGKEHINEKSYLYTVGGDIYSSMGMLEKCYQYYDSALAYTPENAMLLNNYAYNLAENGGDLLKAETMSAKALKLQPDNATFIDTYAWVMFRRESYFIARVYIEQAIAKLSPDDSDVATYYEHYGDILAMSGDVDAAVEQWKKAQDAGSDSPTLNKKVELKKYIENETNSIDNNNTFTDVDNRM